MSLAESKVILAALQQAIVTTQIDEYVTCARVCRSCLSFLPIRDRRTRKLQTLFGTVVVSAPRLRVCGCVNVLGLEDKSVSPLAHLLSDRCMPELRRLQAELGSRLSFREDGDMLSALLPCSPRTHSSIRNRLVRVADDLDERDRMLASEARTIGKADTQRAELQQASKAAVRMVAFGAGISESDVTDDREQPRQLAPTGDGRRVGAAGLSALTFVQLAGATSRKTFETAALPAERHPHPAAGRPLDG